MSLVMKDLRCFRAWIGRRILYSKEGLKLRNYTSVGWCRELGSL